MFTKKQVCVYNNNNLRQQDGDNGIGNVKMDNSNMIINSVGQQNGRGLANNHNQLNATIPNMLQNPNINGVPGLQVQQQGFRVQEQRVPSYERNV